MLWHVERTNLYLVASLHFATKPLVLGEEVIRQLEQADTIVFETDEKSECSMHSISSSNDSHLWMSIPASLREETLRTWKQLRLEGDPHRLPVWLAALTIMDALTTAWGFLPENGVERAVRAHCPGKRLFGLELADAGLRAIASGPAREHEEFLSRAVRHQADGKRDLLIAEAAWRSQDAMQMLPIIDKQRLVIPTIHAALISRRNRNWMSRLLRVVSDDHKAVAVVGAMHLIGPDSLPELFAARGFRCTQVSSASSSYLQA